MSEEFSLSPFEEQLAKEDDVARREKELKTKKLFLNERKTQAELDKVVESDRSENINKQLTFGALSVHQIESLVSESRSYRNAAKIGMDFICKDFAGIVPFFKKNLILIGGKTGEGKSTTVANIARSIIGQKNPETGRLRRVLVLTNEEKAEDVYNRITCLGKGWAYVNHDKFTDQQQEVMEQSLRNMAAKGLVTVVDNTYGGAFGTTTTIEGICDVFDNLIRNKEYYDCVLIDYYQNIKSSRVDMYMNEFEVQAKLANKLDQYKNVYPAPIVLMAQVKPNAEGKDEPFEFRIKGRKIICDPATFIMEMEADRSRLRTQWKVHKSRFTEALGIENLFTGFEQGRFVQYTPEFQAKAATYLEEREARKLAAVTGMKENKDES